MTLLPAILTFMHILLIIVPVLLSVAFMTLGERKALGYMQARKGPTLVGPYGLLQPIADGVKLFMKEPSKPFSASSIIFFLSPMLALSIALTLWIPMTFPTQFSSMNLSLIFILTLSSLAVYTTLGSGWASNSKYSLMGAVRAVAQTISYEVSLSLTILCMIVLVGGFNLSSIIESQTYSWFLITCLPVAIIWFISTLAETSRTPFDLAEGESELVSGFNVEYAGGPFALFFLAEYSNMMFMNALSVMLFLGAGSPLQFLGWPQTLLVAIKITFLSFIFLWIRGSYPRFRYDQLMHLAWKTYLPLTLGLLAFLAAFPIAFNFTPPY